MQKTNKRMVVATLLGIVALVVAACGTSSNSGTTGTTTNGYNFSYNYTAPGAGQNQGTITFADYQSVDTLNPLLATAEIDVKNINLLLDGCVVQLPDYTLGDAGWKPDQCTAVPTVANGGESADGKTTTLHLDPNSKWSDGQPVIADDYIFYYDMIVDPGFGGLSGSPPWSDIASVTSTDPNTVVIAWKQSFGPYLAALWAPFPSHAFPQAWNATTKKYTTPSAGTLGSATFNFNYPSNGPYKLQSSSANSEVYVANTSFHSNFFKGPNAKEIIFKGLGTQDSEIAGFKAGGIDQADDFTVANLPSFSGAGIPASEQINSPGLSFEHIDFNLRPQAINAKDKNNTSGASIFSGANGKLVRQAFIEAFNLCGAFQAVLNDTNCKDPNLYTGENTAPPAADFDSSVSVAAYNITQAQKDLAAAGYPGCKYANGTPITLNFSTTAGNPLRQDWAQLATTEWKTVLGCQFSLNFYPSSSFFAPFTANGILYGGNWDISLFAYVDGSECSLNDTTYLSTNIPSTTQPFASNDSGLQDSQIDSYVNQALSTVSGSARVAICKQFQQYFTSQSYNIPLYIRANFTLALSTLGNYKLNATSVGNTWNAGDWFTTAAA